MKKDPRDERASVEDTPDALSNDALMQWTLARSARLVAEDAELKSALPSPAAMNEIRACASTLESVATAFRLYADRPCLGERAFARDGASLRALPEFRTTTYADVWSRVTAFASGLVHAGIAGTGSFTGILGFASSEWVVADLACLYLAAVSAPLQTTFTTATLQEVVREAELTSVVCSIDQLGAMTAALRGCPSVRSVVVMDLREGDGPAHATLQRTKRSIEEATPGVRVHGFAEIEALGRARGVVPGVPPSARAEADPLMTLMYTSGSTGTPKGAMFPESLWRRHIQAPGHARHVADLPHVGLLSLPLNHAAGRFHLLMSILFGGVTYIVLASDMSTFFEDARIVRPTALFLVPRMAEVLHQSYESRVAKRAFGKSDDERRRIEREVLASMRSSALGDRLLVLSLGSAPTPPDVVSFLKRAFEVPVHDGYGSTEASMLTFDGKVDPAVTAFEIIDVPELGYRASDRPYPRGELRIKSPNTVPGYYKNEQATKDLFDERGFLVTGDIVEQRGPDELVWIDRAKNVVKLAQGEYVPISRLEGIFASQSPFIRQVYLYGSSVRSYLVAVVVPDLDAIGAHLRARGSEPPEAGELHEPAEDGGIGGKRARSLPDAAVKRVLRDELAGIGVRENLRGFEVPRDFLVEREPFTKESGLLTETEKPARAKLRAHYGARLDELYATIERTQLVELYRLEGARGGASPAEMVRKAIAAVLGLRDASEGETQNSFLQLGGDSLSAVRLSALLEDLSGVHVPVGLLLDPTLRISAIADHVERALAYEGHRRPTFASIHGQGAEVLHARDLRVERFLRQETLDGARAATPASALPPEARIALLTGANGFLGRFLVIEALERLPRDGRLVCIVRAPHDNAAADRLRAVFRGLDPELEARFATLASGGRLIALAGDLMKPHLGLSEGAWTKLASDVDAVIHNGALVNHAMSYRALFEPNVLGTAAILALAVTRRMKALTYVSTIAAVNSLDRAGAATMGPQAAPTPGPAEPGPVREDEDLRAIYPDRPLDVGYASGYAASKWASEALLLDAHDRLGLPLRIVRPSGIMAHARYRGQINVPDFFTRLLAGLVYTGVAPRSFYERASDAPPHYDGLPVDAVARSITAIALAGARDGSAATYHVVNPYRDDGVSLDTIVDWMNAAGYRIERLDDYADWYRTFRERLTLLPERQRQHSPLPIVSAWERPARTDRGWLDASKLRARLRDLSRVGEDLASLPHVTEPFIQKYLRDMAALGILASAPGRSAAA